MPRNDSRPGPSPGRSALAHALKSGSTLVCLASLAGPPGWARADERPPRRLTQAVPGQHDMSIHAPARSGNQGMRGLPAPLPDSPAARVPLTGARPTHVPSPTPTPVIGLSDFERIALERNPTLRQAYAQLEAARSRSFQAGLYPNPTVGYVQEQIGALGEVRPTSSGVSTRGAGTPGELVGGFVQQEIVTGGKLKLSRAKFVEEANAALFQADAQKLKVLGGVRLRFFEVIAAQRLVSIHRELVRLNEDAVRTTEQLVNVGQANAPDLLQARVEARRAVVKLRNAENRLSGSWEKLIALAGAPELRPAPLDDRLLDAEAPPLDFERTLANLLHSSPEIKAAVAEIRRSQIMVRRERAEPIPNVTVQAIVGRNYEFDITTAGVQVALPLPIWNRNQGTVREAQSDLMRDHAEHERVALSLRNRLADAANRYNDALQSVDDFRVETLPLARSAYEMQLANYGQRRAAWPQVLVARRTLFELDQEYVQSLLELRRAEVEIGGMLLVDGLSPPDTPTSQGHIESVPQPR